MDIIERIMPGIADVERSKEEFPADWTRYEFATKFVVGKKTIDCASGAGYGSWTLGKAGAASVIGIDLAQEAVDWATKNFSLPNVTFRKATKDRLPIDDESVEVAVSFETIEHVPEAAAPAFVDELARVLVPGGLLVMSTPLTRGPARLSPPNEFHLREYDEHELEALLSPRFVIDQRFGQQSLEGDRFARLRRAPGLGAMVRAGAHRVVPAPIRRLLRERLLGRRTATNPRRAWITEDWKDAPVQIAIARKR